MSMYAMDSVENAVETTATSEATGVLIEGLVTRKDRGRYMVQVEDASIPCAISSMLRKRLLYPLRDPNSLPHYEVQRVEDIQVIDPVAIGDRVVFVDAGDGSGLIKEVMPRRSKLSRLAASPKDRSVSAPLEQVLVANVDQMVAVFAAARPAPKWHLLDRYLVTAEAAGVPAVICITKLDLVNAGGLANIAARYTDLGYTVVLTSSVDRRGIAELRALLAGRVSVLLGKSGVGKSSLLNTIEPGLGLRVSEVGSGRIGKGRHTTTHLELVPLSSGGGVVDTPGMRELALWQARPQALPSYFPEFRPYLGTCKFGASCQHNREPGCAIKEAVDDKVISEERYLSYLRLAEEVG